MHGHMGWGDQVTDSWGESEGGGRAASSTQAPGERLSVRVSIQTEGLALSAQETRTWGQPGLRARGLLAQEA